MRPALKLEQEYKSVIEGKVAKQLDAAGINYRYEGVVLKFTIPGREARYHPDFPIAGSMIIETKGRFGHRGSGGAEVRQRLALVKQQHPELDIRILFSDERVSKLPIYKGSKTTQGQWATDHGFKWAFATKQQPIPPKWLEEMKNAQHRAGSEAQPAGKKRALSSAKKR